MEEYRRRTQNMQRSTMTNKELFDAGLYVSLHSRVNGRDGINENGLKEVLDEMYNDNWEDCEVDEPIKGNQIRYIVRWPDKDKFVAGGFVLSNNLDEEYIAYLCGKRYIIRHEDIVMIWKKNGRTEEEKIAAKERAKERKKEREGEGIIKYEQPSKYGSIEVKIGDVVVYRNDDSSKVKRFLRTKKYEKACKNGFIFV